MASTTTATGSTMTATEEEAVAPAKGIDWDDLPDGLRLGEMSDEDLARKLGVAAQGVGRQRRKRKIPVYVDVPDVDWSDKPLGKLSDADLAAQLWVHTATVYAARTRRGVSAFAKAKKAAPNTAATTTATATSTKTAGVPANEPSPAVRPVEATEQAGVFGREPSASVWARVATAARDVIAELERDLEEARQVLDVAERHVCGTKSE